MGYFQSKLYLISLPHIDYDYLSTIIQKPNISISRRRREPERKITTRTIHIFPLECAGVYTEVPLCEGLKLVSIARLTAALISQKKMSYICLHMFQKSTTENCMLLY